MLHTPDIPDSIFYKCFNLNVINKKYFHSFITQAGENLYQSHNQQIYTPGPFYSSIKLLRIGISYQALNM